jgi:NADPH:quinone reductase-like Zn-dependent oxidoreductase
MLADVAAPKGEYLLVSVAGSALNRLLMPLAHRQGAKVIGTVRRPEAVDELKAEGYAWACFVAHQLLAPTLLLSQSAQLLVFSFWHT